MKFIVNKKYNDEYDVKLHWETKDKLKQAAYFLSLAVGTLGVIKLVDNARTEDQK